MALRRALVESVTRTGAFAALKENASVFRTRWVQVNPYEKHTAKKHTENGVLFTGDSIGTRTRVCAVRGRRPDR